MRLFHLSDVHFSDKYLVEVKRCAEFAAAHIHREPENMVDLIVLSGDLFDHRLEQNSPALMAAVDWVQSLAHVAPVLILQGTLSHDAPNALTLFRHLQTVWPVHVADCIQRLVLHREGHFDKFDAHTPLLSGDLVINCLPSVNKGQVAAAVGAEAAAEAAGQAVSELLLGWADLNFKARAAGVPTIVVSHGTVSGSMSEHGHVMAGLDHEFTVGALMGSRANAVMLGHIHKHQSWGNGDTTQIAYAGSLARLHFGEHDPKGFLLWEVDAQSAAYSFIETPARQLVDLEFSGPPDLVEVQRAVAALPEGGELRVRYAVDEEHRHSVDVDALKGLVGDRGKVEGRVLPVQRQRAAGIGKTASLHDKVRQWCDIAGADPAPLLERLDLLLAGDAPTTIITQEKAA